MSVLHDFKDKAIAKQEQEMIDNQAEFMAWTMLQDRHRVDMELEERLMTPKRGARPEHDWDLNGHLIEPNRKR